MGVGRGLFELKSTLSVGVTLLHLKVHFLWAWGMRRPPPPNVQGSIDALFSVGVGVGYWNLKSTLSVGVTFLHLKIALFVGVGHEEAPTT